MRYLTQSKTGIWYFRFQIPAMQRTLFGGRREIKRSLRTTVLEQAKVVALELELETRKRLLSQSQDPIIKETSYDKPTTSSRRASKKELTPFELLELYCSYKSEYVSTKTLEGQKAKCRIVLELLNKVKLKDIRRADAERIRYQLKSFPANSKKLPEFKGLTNLQILSLNQKVKKQGLSESSIKDYMQKLSSFFEWCLQNEHTDVNPFKSIRFKKTRKDSDSKNHYTDEQLRKIFSNDIFTKKTFKHHYQYWLPILAIHTGARLNELCQLYTDDITKIDGIWCIKIRAERPDQRLKNLNSERVIPIHNQLLRLGFLDFVKAQTHDRLFSELPLKRDGYGTVVSKWFGRFKSDLGFKRGHDFHSFRHTVATYLKNSDVNVEVAAEIFGHSSGTITYDRYAKRLKIHKLAEAINKLPPTALN
ncbi:tyrosine-type recombinase/integrase [Vibrio cyclitrophicus]|uniref:tyrosine-type recombinase/integrase n=1 Tax=Vibrio cyclitrophicus TaxID=47951 RepID=UPI0011B39F87|nr:tyrosine-type recombinase/integrase [Vibrio cyclitrophicus]